MLTTNTVHWGDCLSVMQDIPDGSIDMILVDPPYGVTVQAWDKVIPYEAFWQQHNRVIKPNGAILVTASQPFASHLIVSNEKYFRYDLVWKKNRKSGYLNAKKMPLRQHEFVLVFYKKLPVYHPQKTFGHKPVNTYHKKPNSDNVYGKLKYVTKGGGQTDRYPTSIIDIAGVNNDSPARNHANQKPVELLRWLIRTYSCEGDVILDSCLGSGSTAIAALLEGRQFIGIEKEYEFYRGAVARIAAETTKLPSARP